LSNTFIQTTYLSFNTILLLFYLIHTQFEIQIIGKIEKEVNITGGSISVWTFNPTLPLAPAITLKK
jgi:hypothetical protein